MVFLLKDGWEYKQGDNLSWANIDNKDADWKKIDPTKKFITYLRYLTTR
ncbi:MAG: hypothetical protein IPO94_17115 [Saprospiraceae bacterium]|nr:hypothetical protein [Saprospiraceae bacterium]